MKPTGIALFFIFLMMPVAQAATTTDAEIRQAVIQESLAAYPGPCPCPYNTMRNGRACGRRSAYSRPGGYAPICYPEQVTPAMIQDYQARHR
jgi:hypothetical protein